MNTVVVEQGPGLIHGSKSNHNLCSPGRDM